jgi:hypothetical protein
MNIQPAQGISHNGQQATTAPTILRREMSKVSSYLAFRHFVDARSTENGHHSSGFRGVDVFRSRSSG